MSDWTAQASPGISFDDENALIRKVRQLAKAAGLSVVGKKSLDHETRAAADLALERNGQYLLFAKRRKLNNTTARVDVDRRPRPRHVLLEKDETHDWVVLTDSRIPIEGWRLDETGLKRLADLMLAP